MTENNENGNGVTTTADNKPKRNMTFTLTSIAAFTLIPVSIVAAIIITILLQPSFYTGILKDGRFITAFIQAKSWQKEQNVSDEIERELHLAEFTKEFEKIRARYERSKDEYLIISRDAEIGLLEKQRKELKDLDWEQVRETYTDKKDFEQNRDSELARVKNALGAIKEYRELNRDRIKSAEEQMNDARDEFEDALATLEDKKKEAEKISRKHRDTVSGKLYADLEKIEGPLSKVLNERLIDGAVRSEIEKVIRFFTGYDRQIEQRNVYYELVMDEGLLGRRALRVRLPEIGINLWVDDETGGLRVKKHVLSQLLVEELQNINALQNHALLMTIFKMSDSRLGEHFGGRYLGKLGLTINNGVIRWPGLVLKDRDAEIASAVMQALSWGQYAIYGVAGLAVLFLVYLFFSTAERRRKLVMMKRLLLYPSILFLILCGALLWASRNIFNYYPDFIADLSVRSYVKYLSFTAAWHFSVPILAVFGALLAGGLAIRKYLAWKDSKNTGRVLDAAPGESPAAPHA
ncbi:MAG: hypothetical protein JW807_14960 [Spirochaetes bacterium]|nr:hypothetical protein [Spirochaetota bacterium]